MALLLLRTVEQATSLPGGGLATAYVSDYYDDVNNRLVVLYASTGAAFELVVGQEVTGYCRLGGTRRIIRYAGNGTVRQVDIANHPSCSCALLPPTLTFTAATYPGAVDATLTAEWAAGTGATTLTLSPSGLSVNVPAGTLSYTFTGLPAGQYTVVQTTPGGCSATARAELEFAVSGIPQSWWLTAQGDPMLEIYYWNKITKVVESIEVDNSSGAYTPYLLTRGVDSLMDSYLEPGSTHLLRSVLANGSTGVRFTLSDLRQRGRLWLENIVYTHPDRPDEDMGGILLEAETTDGPLEYSLSEAITGLVGTNATGYFDNLPVGEYTYTIADATGRTLTGPVKLEAKYSLWGELDYGNRLGTPLRLEIHRVGTFAEVVALKGQAEPLTLTTDGVAGGDLENDLPPAVGTQATLRLLAPADFFADLEVADDRAARVDFYQNGQLHFRGFVQPGVYTAPLLSGDVAIELTATCGLAGLKTTAFAGHAGQMLYGRWPVLHTLLHCLSRTSTSLRLTAAVNRRALEMSDDTCPLLATATDRAGYTSDKGEPLDCRTVVDALCVLLGGTLVQRYGRWELCSAQEAPHPPVPARRYGMGGTLLTTTALATVRTIKPPTAAGPGDFYWQDARQSKSLRPGWKSVTVDTDLRYATNVLRGGEDFSRRSAWNEEGTALLDAGAWESVRPSVLYDPVYTRITASDNDAEVGASWPMSFAMNSLVLPEPRYIESAPLPLVAIPEGVPAVLSVVARLRGGPTPTATARLTVELVLDGARQSPMLLLFPHGKETTAQVALPAIPPGVKSVRLRIYPYVWAGTPPLPGAYVFVLRKVQLQLMPLGFRFASTDTFRADGPAGTVRPRESRDVFHADIPVRAGLFAGGVWAFQRAASTTTGEVTSKWRRGPQEVAAPLLESAAYDQIQLRARPTRLLEGALRGGTPLRLLDVVDAPDDVPGRRLWVVASIWRPRAAVNEVRLVEIAAAPLTVAPTAGLPENLILLEELQEFTPGEYMPIWFVLEDGTVLVKEPE